ncbi:MAG: HAD-IA family hydrolase [Chloroflexi bacterium]|nr:HAD-IA family hydrolase [Chloroflexota bacterium]
MGRQWVVFDVMGVIFEVGDDTNDLLVPFVQRLNPTISTSTIRELYLRTSLGELSSEEFWTQLGFAGSYPEIEYQYLDTSFSLDGDFFDTTDGLRAKYNLAILSNDVYEWASFLRRKYDIDRFFEHVVVSGEAKYRKPDLRVFEVLLGKLKTSAANCVLIDDKLDNLRSAKALSFKTVLLNRQGKTNSPDADFEIVRLADLPDAVAKVFGHTLA